MVNEFKDALTKKMHGLTDKLWKKFLIEVEQVLKEDFYPILVDAILENYKRLPQGPVDDPTALELWEDVFRNHLLSTDVINNSISVSSDGINIGIGNRDLLGYGKEGKDEAPEPIIWMVYFISDTAAAGIAGRFAFISKKDYETRSGSGSYLDKWGRFGEGFMVSQEEYESEGWEKVLGPFSNKEHPLSKMLDETGPINIFEDAFKQVQESENNISTFLQKALNNALGSIKKI